VLWLSWALASEGGLVVSFNAGELTVEGEVVCLLTSDAATTEIVLSNDGTNPDVIADDTLWAGSIIIAGDSFDVVLLVDGQELGQGIAEYSEDEEARDLRMAWTGDAVSFETGIPTSSEPADPNVGGTPVDPDEMAPLDPSVGGEPLDPGEGGPPLEQGEGGEPLDPGQGGQGADLPPLPGSGSSGDNPALLIGLGLGLLVLAGIVFAWLRSGGGTGYHIKTRAALQDEPPFLGPGGPVLSQGLHRVKVEGDPTDLAQTLLPILAQHHRVLVAGVDQIPAVWGGPVYLTTAEKAVHVGDAAEDLLDGPGMPLVVLSVGIGGLDEQLPEGIGGLWLGTEGEVVATKDDAGWLLGDHPLG